ncbi:MAG: hypothetical protein PHU08_00915 [Dehalococcoidales bacterium]|nr:hypothetical protein [Dehalococcoidales bacterium]
MRQVAGVEVLVNELKQVDSKQLAGFDTILVGSPNHIGNATGGIRKFISNLGKLRSESKSGAVFDTYMGTAFEQAVKKMEKLIGEKAPWLKLISPGLSIKVDGMKGPIAAGELARSKDFGAKIATAMQSKK